MFRLFITLLFAITASAGILFANTYLAYQQSKQSTIEQDRLLMRDIKNQLVLSVIRDNDTGIFMLPYGVSGDNGHKLPNSLALPKTNAFGLNYVYCPFSSNTGAYNQTVQLNSANNYQVFVKNDSSTNNQDYVLYSQNIVANNVLGYVISNHKRDEQIDCLDLINSESLIFDNSIVQVIYRDELSYSNIIDNAFYNIQNSNDFNEGMIISSNRNSQNAVFLLENDINNINSVLFHNNSGNQSKVVIKGDGVFEINSLSEIDLVFNNMDVVFENILIGENINISVNNSNISFINSLIYNLESSYSKVSFDNSDIIVSSEFSFIHSDISIFNSVDISSSVNNAFLLFNSNLKSNNSLLNASGQTIFNFDYSSSINLFNTDIEAVAENIFLGNGVVNLNGVIANGGVRSINATKGARLSINNTDLLSSGFSVIDNGIMLLSGAGNRLNNGCIADYETREIKVAVEYESFVDGEPLMKETEIQIDLNDQFRNFNFECL